MYPEADYSLYKFARTRHGFWFWVINLLAIGGHPYTLLVGDWHWSWVVVTVVVEFVYWRVIVWSHRNRLRKMNEKGSNNKHRDDVCETCDPVCWKVTRAPLLELRVYYAAVTDASWEMADHELGRMHPSALQLWKEDHARYLKRKEFDKFLRK